jgi:hypothetical protein
MMFAVFCERHGTTVLLGSADVVAVMNVPDGPLMHWECFCGHTGTFIGRSERALSGSDDQLVCAQQGLGSPAERHH